MGIGERIRRATAVIGGRINVPGGFSAGDGRGLAVAVLPLAGLVALGDPGPDGLLHMAAILALACCAVIAGSSRSTAAWSSWLLLTLALTAIGAAHRGVTVDFAAAVVVFQGLAAVTGPTRGAGRLAAAAVGVVALASAAGYGGQPWHAGAPLLLAGWAVAAALASQRARPAREELAAPRGGVSETRVELERARHELDVLASQLRREATQRRQAEAQALDAMSTRNAFLGVMSHELRTPLSQIIGYSELLLEESQESGEEAGDVERIHLASLGLLEVIANILDMSKIEAGKQAVAAEEFAVAELLENLEHSFGTQARRRGNVIRVRCPGDLPLLVTDRTKLRTILASLLSNACKFTEGGTIRIAVRTGEQAGIGVIVFEVSDTGIGIAAEQLERIFAPFVQADGATTRRHDGSGLGLAISRHFCAMLGGEITVESEPGRGSLFRVQVPLRHVDPRRAGIVVASLASSLA